MNANRPLLTFFSSTTSQSPKPEAQSTKRSGPWWALKWHASINRFFAKKTTPMPLDLAAINTKLRLRAFCSCPTRPNPRDRRTTPD